MDYTLKTLSLLFFGGVCFLAGLYLQGWRLEPLQKEKPRICFCDSNP